MVQPKTSFTIAISSGNSFSQSNEKIRQQSHNNTTHKLKSEIQKDIQQVKNQHIVKDNGAKSISAPKIEE